MYENFSDMNFMVVILLHIVLIVLLGEEPM